MQSTRAEFKKQLGEQKDSHSQYRDLLKSLLQKAFEHKDPIKVKQYILQEWWKYLETHSSELHKPQKSETKESDLKITKFNFVLPETDAVGPFDDKNESQVRTLFNRFLQEIEPQLNDEQIEAVANHKLQMLEAVGVLYTIAYAYDSANIFNARQTLDVTPFYTALTSANRAFEEVADQIGLKAADVKAAEAPSEPSLIATGLQKLQALVQKEEQKENTIVVDSHAERLRSIQSTFEEKSEVFEAVKTYQSELKAKQAGLVTTIEQALTEEQQKYENELAELNEAFSFENEKQPGIQQAYAAFKKKLKNTYVEADVTSLEAEKKQLQDQLNELKKDLDQRIPLRRLVLRDEKSGARQHDEEVSSRNRIKVKQAARAVSEAFDFAEGETSPKRERTYEDVVSNKLVDIPSIDDLKQAADSKLTAISSRYNTRYDQLQSALTAMPKPDGVTGAEQKTLSEPFVRLLTNNENGLLSSEVKNIKGKINHQSKIRLSEHWKKLQTFVDFLADKEALHPKIQRRKSFDDTLVEKEKEKSATLLSKALSRRTQDGIDTLKKALKDTHNEAITDRKRKLENARSRFHVIHEEIQTQRKALISQADTLLGNLKEIDVTTQIQENIENREQLDREQKQALSPRQAPQSVGETKVAEGQPLAQSPRADISATLPESKTPVSAARSSTRTTLRSPRGWGSASIACGIGSVGAAGASTAVATGAIPSSVSLFGLTTLSLSSIPVVGWAIGAAVLGSLLIGGAVYCGYRAYKSYTGKQESLRDFSKPQKIVLDNENEYWKKQGIPVDTRRLMTRLGLKHDDVAQRKHVQNAIRPLTKDEISCSQIDAKASETQTVIYNTKSHSIYRVFKTADSHSGQQPIRPDTTHDGLVKTLAAPAA